MIWFDGIHLMSDKSLDELHVKAQEIGLKREWFQDHPRHPHYDVFGALKQKLTVNCTSREFIHKYRSQQK